MKKSNLVPNWDQSYRDLDRTFSMHPESISELSNLLEWQRVYADVKSLIDTGNPKICEVGCGGARNSVFLASKGYSVWCTDSSDEALRLAKANFTAAGVRGEIIKDNLLSSALPKSQFDVVMSFGLLEHFESLEDLTRALTELVKPGGIQIHNIIPQKFSSQSITNMFHYPVRFLRRVARRDFHEIFSKSFRDFPHFENEFSVGEYCRAFEKAGNQILKVEFPDPILGLLQLGGGVDRLIKSGSRIPEALMVKFYRSKGWIARILSPSYYVVVRRVP